MKLINNTKAIQIKGENETLVYISEGLMRKIMKEHGSNAIGFGTGIDENGNKTDYSTFKRYL